MTNPENREAPVPAVRVSLSIPPRDLEILERIVDMAAEARENLWATIDAAPAGTQSDDLEARIVSGASLTQDEASGIVAMLSRMYLTKERGDDIASDEFVDAVVRAVAAAKKTDVDDGLRSIMRRLLSFEGLGIKIRAEQVMAEYEHVMDEARILTDIRPIFNNEDPPAIVATVVTHNLRIRHVDNAGHTNDFVVLALDSVDLKDLGKIIDRATKKEAKIRAFMAKSGVLCIATTTAD